MADVRTSHAATPIPPRGPHVGFQGMTREKRIKAAIRGGRVRGVQKAREAKRARTLTRIAERAARRNRTACRERSRGTYTEKLLDCLGALAKTSLYVAPRTRLTSYQLSNARAKDLEFRGLAKIRKLSAGLAAYITPLGQQVYARARGAAKMKARAHGRK